MALVKCTAKLKDEILNNIDALFKERLQEAKKLRGITDREVADTIYNQTHTPARLAALKDLESIYAGFRLTENTKQFKFAVACAVEANAYQREFDVKFDVDKPVLRDFAASWSASPRITDAPDTIVNPIIEAKQRYEAVYKEKEDFKKIFSDAWEKVKSVNELIKLWPAVTDLLPAGIMPRINKKSGKRKIEEEVFDVQGLNVALLKAKVAK